MLLVFVCTSLFVCPARWQPVSPQPLLGGHHRRLDRTSSPRSSLARSRLASLDDSPAPRSDRRFLRSSRRSAPRVHISIRTTINLVLREVCRPTYFNAIDLLLGSDRPSVGFRSPLASPLAGYSNGRSGPAISSSVRRSGSFPSVGTIIHSYKFVPSLVRSFVCLSVSLSVRPSVRPSCVRPFVRSSVRPSVRSFFRLAAIIRPTVRPSVRPHRPSARPILHPSIRSFDGPSVRLSVRLFVRRFVLLFIHSSVVNTFYYPSVLPSVSSSVSPFVHLSVRQSVRPYVFPPSVHQSVRPSVRVLIRFG